MKNQAMVIETKGEECQVMVFRTEACGSCDSCNSCHSTPAQYWIKNEKNAKEGDLVTIDFETRSFLTSIAKLYLMPLFLFIGGVLLTGVLLSRLGHPSELLSFGGGLLGLGVSMLLSRFMDRHFDRSTIHMISIDSVESVLDCCSPQGGKYGTTHC